MDRKISVEAIFWIDPHSIDEWRNIEDIDLSHIAMRSVGQVIREDNNSILMSLNYDPENESVSCSMVIPKHTIVKREIVYVYEDEEEA